MNWLAHILLAGDDPEMQLGGVLADLLTLPQTKALPPSVRRGIALHQTIDAFCDAHPAVSASNRRISGGGVGLRPAAAAVAVDMLYDHLLARDWARYGLAQSLETFCANFYQAASTQAAIIPPKARLALDLMRAENWLVSYRDLGEIRHTLERIRRRLSPRAAELSPLASAVDVFARDPAAFEADFARFWPDMAAHVDAFDMR